MSRLAEIFGIIMTCLYYVERLAEDPFKVSGAFHDCPSVISRLVIPGNVDMGHRRSRTSHSNFGLSVYL